MATVVLVAVFASYGWIKANEETNGFFERIGKALAGMLLMVFVLYVLAHARCWGYLAPTVLK